MGKIRGRAGEGLSGLVGNAVFFSYNGQTYIRTRPARKKKYSWSERQLLNQKRFRFIKAFWSRFDHSPIQEIWKVAEERKRGDNLFVSVNMPAFGSDGTLIDPERLHFSEGQLPLPFRLMAARSQADPDKVEVIWQDNPGSAVAWEDDKLMMMFSSDGNFTGPITTGALRKQESALISLPPGNVTIDAIWLYFASDKRKLYSWDHYFKI
jgi:hypothetical protein